MLGLTSIFLYCCGYLMVLNQYEASIVQSLTQPCPTNPWGPWSACSTNCGIGTKSRTREVQSGTPPDSECISRTQLVDTEDCQDLSGCDPDQGKQRSVCTYKFDKGLCNASFLVWTYDLNARKCVEAVYGGCHGNKNRFKTEEECKRTCVA